VSSGMKKHRLLIVDDESDLRELLSEVLISEGYEIVTASDGAEAIGILEREKFDAALLDILMPNENGFTVLKHISEHHPSTKSIMLTGHSDLHTAVEAKNNGAAEFISKPYKLETVLSALRKVLNM